MKNTMKLMAFLCCITLTVNAQKFDDLDKSPMDVTMYRTPDKQALARVIYSRPQKRDRKIFGELIKYGKVWRTGANEATEITLYHGMKFGDTQVAPGTYSLFTIPGEKEWTVILNKKTNEWGSYTYDQAMDVARTTVPVKAAAAPIEAFSMSFLPEESGAKLLMVLGYSLCRSTFS